MDLIPTGPTKDYKMENQMPTCLRVSIKGSVESTQLSSRVSALRLEGCRFNPKRVLPKIITMVPFASLLRTHYLGVKKRAGGSVDSTKLTGIKVECSPRDWQVVGLIRTGKTTDLY